MKVGSSLIGDARRGFAAVLRFLMHDRDLCCSLRTPARRCRRCAGVRRRGRASRSHLGLASWLRQPRHPNHGRYIEVHALAGEECALPVEWKMRVVFSGEDFSERLRASPSARNRMGRRGRLRGLHAVGLLGDNGRPGCVQIYGKVSPNPINII